MVTCVYFVPSFPNFSLFCVPVGTTILIIVKHRPRPCKNHANFMLCKNHAKFAPLVPLMIQHSFNLWLPKLARVGTVLAWDAPLAGFMVQHLFDLWLQSWHELAQFLHKVCSQSWHKICIRGCQSWREFEQMWGPMWEPI